VAAGDTINLQWTDWPFSHHGPVLTYLAPAGDNFKSIDKVDLRFVKIEEVGLLRNNSNPLMQGFYGADRLREQGSRWQVKVPSYVAPGNYVMRHEIIALMQAAEPNKAQHYPQCINLKVTGNGKDPLTSGIRARDMYEADHPGILVQIYQPLDYQIPGPPLYKPNNAASTPEATTLAKRTSAASSKAASTPQAKFAAKAAPKDDSSTTPIKRISAAPSNAASTPAAKFADNAPPQADSTTRTKNTSVPPASAFPKFPRKSSSPANAVSTTSAPAAVTTSVTTLVGAPATTLISSVDRRPANGTLFPSFARLPPKSQVGAKSAVGIPSPSPVAASTPSGVGENQGALEYKFTGFDQGGREPETPSPPKAAEESSTPEAAEGSSAPKAAEGPSTPKAAKGPSTPKAVEQPSTPAPEDSTASVPQSYNVAAKPQQNDRPGSQSPASEDATPELSEEDFEFPQNATVEQIVAFLEKLVRRLKEKVLGGKRKYARDFSTQ
jgi:hypothetical protein